MYTQKLDTLAYGVGGFSASVVAEPALDALNTGNVVQVIVQIIIGIATLVGMFKKNKKN